MQSSRSIKDKFLYNGKAYETGQTTELGTQPEVLVQFAAEEASAAELVLTFDDGLQAPQRITVNFNFQHVPFKMLSFRGSHASEIKFCKFSELKFVEFGPEATDEVDYKQTGISYIWQYRVLEGKGKVYHTTRDHISGRSIPGER